MFIYTAMPHLLLAGCTTRLSPTPFTAVHDQSPFLLPVLTYAFPRINSAEMSMAGAQALHPFWSHVLLADVLSPSPALTVTHHRSEAQIARPGVPRVKELSLLCLMDTHSQQCGMGQSSGWELLSLLDSLLSRLEDNSHAALPADTAKPLPCSATAAMHPITTSSVVSPHSSSRQCCLPALPAQGRGSTSVLLDVSGSNTRLLFTCWSVLQTCCN